MPESTEWHRVTSRSEFYAAMERSWDAGWNDHAVNGDYSENDFSLWFDMNYGIEDD